SSTRQCRPTTKFSDRTPAYQHAGAPALVCAPGSAARGRALYGDAARCNAKLGGAVCTDRSYRGQWYMRRWRHHHRNCISGMNVTAIFDDTHDSSLSDQAAIGCAVENCSGEAEAEAVQLCAGIA